MCENCNGYTVKLPRGAPCARGDARWIRANMNEAAAFAAGLGVVDEDADYGAGTEYGAESDSGGALAHSIYAARPADPPALANVDRWTMWPRPRAKAPAMAMSEVIAA